MSNKLSRIYKIDLIIIIDILNYNVSIIPNGGTEMLIQKSNITAGWSATKSKSWQTKEHIENGRGKHYPSKEDLDSDPYVQYLTQQSEKKLKPSTTPR